VVAGPADPARHVEVGSHRLPCLTHLEGMSGARAVVAINTDPRAPIFRVAHLGLVADLHAVLRETEAELAALEPR